MGDQDSIIGLMLAGVGQWFWKQYINYCKSLMCAGKQTLTKSRHIIDLISVKWP